MQIDHDEETPLYLQLAGVLRRQIETGELAPGRSMPSEAVLTQQHGVARETARDAVGALREAGLVRFVFGRGTFVVPPGERIEARGQDALQCAERREQGTERREQGTERREQGTERREQGTERSEQDAVRREHDASRQTTPR